MCRADNSQDDAGRSYQGIPDRLGQQPMHLEYGTHIKSFRKRALGSQIS